MKTKSELKGSPVTSLESWRKLDKGERASQQRTQASGQAQFRIAGYVRLSPSGDEREEGSLVSHPQRIKQFVESKNYQNGGTWGSIVEWYTDKDLSGKDMNRPAFQRMLADIASGRINAVVVTELSRLNRKVKDFCEVYDFFKEYKVALFSLRENFDTSTAIGELMLIQAMSFAQYERQTIVDRIKRGARARAERGLANGYIPLGFKAVPHRPNHREVDENERAYVEMIYRKFLELKRLKALIHFLNSNGYSTKEFVTKKGKKAGGNRWTLSSIYSVLTNRAYIGEREINKKNRSSGETDLREEEQYFYVDAQWPALIARELFFDVQALLEQNRKKARRYIHHYRLTGLIQCAECGAPLVGKSGTGTSAKYFYYGHKRKMVTKGDQHLHRCRVENIPAVMLEEAVIARIKEYAHDRDLVAELAKRASSEFKARVDHQKSLIAAKEQERRKLQQKVDNLYEAIAETDDKVLRSGLAEKAKECQAQLEQAECGLSELKADYERTRNTVEADAAFEFFREFRREFDKQPVAVQAEILKEYVRRIVIRENVAIVEIYGCKPRMVLIPGGQENGPLRSRKSLEIDANNKCLYQGQKKSLMVPLTRRSAIRTDFKLVAGAGFEPTTFGL